MGLGAGVAPVQAGANVFPGIGPATGYMPPPPDYGPPAYPPPVCYVADGAEQLGCGEAAGLIRREGFRFVDTIDCEGAPRYVFLASRGGVIYRVRIDSWSGEIVSVARAVVN